MRVFRLACAYLRGAIEVLKLHSVLHRRSRANPIEPSGYFVRADEQTRKVLTDGVEPRIERDVGDRIFIGRDELAIDHSAIENIDKPARFIEEVLDRVRVFG